MLFSVMAARPPFRYFGYVNLVMSEIRSLVHHDHLYQVFREFLKQADFGNLYPDWDSVIECIPGIPD